MLRWFLEPKTDMLSVLSDKLELHVHSSCFYVQRNLPAKIVVGAILATSGRTGILVRISLNGFLLEVFSDG